MALDFTTAYASLYSRAGAASSITTLVNSIFDADELGNLTGKQLPYLVWRYLDPDMQSEQMGNLNAGWYAYVAANGNKRLLTDIATAVYNLYGGENRLAISGGNLHALAPRAPFFDKALSLRGIYIPIYWRTLG